MNLLKIAYKEFKQRYSLYGSSWTYYRHTTFSDQIKAKLLRIRHFEIHGKHKVDESLIDDLKAVANYCAIFIVELQSNGKGKIDYAKKIKKLYKGIIALRNDKNHDYGDAWKEMAVTSFTDIMLTKLQRINNQLDMKKDNEKIVSDLMDIINYCHFYHVRIK